MPWSCSKRRARQAVPYNPPSAECCVNAAHLMVPVIAEPWVVLRSRMNLPPAPDFANVTLPDPLAGPPPRTVLTSCDVLPLASDNVTISPDPSFGFHTERASE